MVGYKLGGIATGINRLVEWSLRRCCCVSSVAFHNAIINMCYSSIISHPPVTTP